MAILFKRRVELSVITKETEQVIIAGETKPFDVNRLVTINGARVSFDFTKTITASPNRGIVKVWGLAQSTINKFLNAGTLNLNVGYESLSETLSGEVSAVKVVKDAESRIVELEMIDGLTIEGSTINRSFAPGTNILGVFRSLFEDVKINNLTDVISLVFGNDLPDDTTKNGITISGPITDEANKITKDLGLRWFNDGGIVKVIRLDGATLEEVVEISARTGLINSPERTEQGVAFTSLLNTKLTPGRRVDLTSDSINGLLLVQSVRLEGDNEQERPFYSHCEAVEIA